MTRPEQIAAKQCESVNGSGLRCDRPSGHPGFHVHGDHLDLDSPVWKDDLSVAQDQVGAILRHTHPVAASPHLKENALRLADHHRATCEGATCTISLIALADLLRLAGFDLTDDDMRRLV